MHLLPNNEHLFEYAVNNIYIKNITVNKNTFSKTIDNIEISIFIPFVILRIFELMCVYNEKYFQINSLLSIFSVYFDHRLTILIND